MITTHLFKRKSGQWLFGLVLLSFVWVLVSNVYARERPAAGDENHFLWSMQTQKNSIYFLGSIHLLKKSSYPLAAEIENAYADCTNIVFETDLDAMKDPAFQALMLSLGLYPEGQTIEQDISRETYEALKEKVKSAGLPMAQFSRFRPWIFGQTLTVIELQSLGFNVMYGIDTYFYGKAKKDKKKMIEYIQFYIWYQMTTGIILVSSLSVYILYMLQSGNLVYAKWLMLIQLTREYPAMLDIFLQGLKVQVVLFRRLR